MRDYKEDAKLYNPLLEGVVISRNPLILKEIVTTTHFATTIIE